VTFWDIAIVIVGLVLVVEGLVKGVVRLLFGLGGLVLGYLYAGYAAAPASRLLAFLPEGARHPVALLAGFVLILGACVGAGVLITFLIKQAGLSGLNRLAGVAAGALAAVYLAGGAVRLAERVSPRLGESARSGPVMRTLSALALGLDALLPDLPARPQAPAEAPAAPETPGAPA
jgi:uncharacterized membrane protein required for colicin V production